MCWNRTGSPPSDGSKMPTPARPLDAEQEQRDGDDRRGQQLDQARRVHRPDEQRQPAPRHAGARILWIVTMMFSPVMIELNPEMNTPSTPGITFVCDDRELYGG